MNRIQLNKLSNKIRRILKEEVSANEIQRKLKQLLRGLKPRMYEGTTEDGNPYTSFNFLINKLVFGEEGVTVYNRDIRKDGKDPIVVISYKKVSNEKLASKAEEFMDLLLRVFPCDMKSKNEGESKTIYTYYTDKYQNGIKNSDAVMTEFQRYI